MELWDLYDKNRQMTGMTHVRGEEIPQGYYHLVVHVWLRNRKGEYLISQRSASRTAFPLMWESVGGSVLIGEDSLHGAIREVKEEIGIDLSPKGGTLLFSETGRIIHGVPSTDILDVWLWNYDGPVHLAAATTDEVAQAVWMHPEEIRQLFETGQLVDTLAYFFQKVAQ